MTDVTYFISRQCRRTGRIGWLHRAGLVVLMVATMAITLASAGPRPTAAARLRWAAAQAPEDTAPRNGGTIPDNRLVPEPEPAPAPGSLDAPTLEPADFPRSLALAEPFLSGQDVVLLQAVLKDWGFYDGPLDGIYGPETARSVSLFQVTNGSLANGSLDDQTRVDLVTAAATQPGPKKNRAAWTPKPKPVGEDIRIVINTDARTLTVLVEGEPYQQYPVAVGRPSLPTPHGNFAIKVKDVWGGGFGARWMQLSVPWGVYGIHGTNNPGSIGSYASHGCVRMFNRHVIELYSWVEVGTPVKIVGRPVRHWGETPRVIGSGICGTDVVRVQEALTDMGLYKGNITGRFNAECIKAVRELQKANGLQVTGEVDAKTWHLLGY